jgi:hypothetical protein
MLQRTPRLSVTSTQSGADEEVGPAAPVQFKMPEGLKDNYGGGGEGNAQAAADRATSGGGGKLPFLDQIQSSFGRHDVRGVQAHVDERASEGASEMGAEAFARGDHIAFAGTPTLHTAAHEAAHVIQQRGGLSLPGGVGKAGDQHEKHADQVADRVARGESAEELLDEYVGKKTESKSGEAANQPVQRKVGFELEYRVPSLRTALSGGLDYHRRRIPGHRSKHASDNVKKFLQGGVKYDTPMGSVPGFRLTADHSGSVDRDPILDALVRNRYITETAVPADLTSNLEYVSEALDELKPHSNQEFQNQFTAIRAHMGSTLAAAQSGAVTALAAPGGAYFTGVPVADLQDWLGPDYAYVTNAVDTLRNNIQDEIYVQATVGIIPSAIRDFNRGHETHQQNAGGMLEGRHAMASVRATIDTLTALPAFQNHAWVKDLHDNWPTSYEALLGMLSLGFTYMVGDALWQTSGYAGGAVKNAVPFLIKNTEIRSKALPDHIRHKHAPRDLVQIIEDHFAGSRFADPGYWTGATDADYNEGLTPRAVKLNKRLLQTDHHSFLERLLRGQLSEIVVGKQELPNPDKLPAEVTNESAGQKGVPLEYRWFRGRPSIAGMDAALFSIVNEVRDANLKHMDPADRLRILNNVV